MDVARERAAARCGSGFRGLPPRGDHGRVFPHEGLVRDDGLALPPRPAHGRGTRSARRGPRRGTRTGHPPARVVHLGLRRALLRGASRGRALPLHEGAGAGGREHRRRGLPPLHGRAARRSACPVSARRGASRLHPLQSPPVRLERDGPGDDRGGRSRSRPPRRADAGDLLRGFSGQGGDTARGIPTRRSSPG